MEQSAAEPVGSCYYCVTFLLDCRGILNKRFESQLILDSFTAILLALASSLSVLVARRTARLRIGCVGPCGLVVVPSSRGFASLSLVVARKLTTS